LRDFALSILRPIALHPLYSDALISALIMTLWIKMILEHLKMGLIQKYYGALIFLALFTLSGCATNEGGYTSASEVQARLQGMTKEELAIKLGAPTESMGVSEELEVWTYRAGSIGLAGGQCVISVSLKNNAVISTKINKTDYSPLAAPLGSCSSIIGSLD
jgi:hypothetical protein